MQWRAPMQWWAPMVGTNAMVGTSAMEGTTAWRHSGSSLAPLMKQVWVKRVWETESNHRQIFPKLLLVGRNKQVRYSCQPLYFVKYSNIRSQYICHQHVNHQIISSCKWFNRNQQAQSGWLSWSWSKSATHASSPFTLDRCQVTSSTFLSPTALFNDWSPMSGFLHRAL